MTKYITSNLQVIKLQTIKEIVCILVNGSFLSRITMRTVVIASSSVNHPEFDTQLVRIAWNSKEDGPFEIHLFGTYWGTVESFVATVRNVENNECEYKVLNQSTVYHIVLRSLCDQLFWAYVVLDTATLTASVTGRMCQMRRNSMKLCEQ
jgi:hypothetical protein